MISQEEKTSDAKRHLFFSCDINENPFGGAEHGARQREGSSLQKARRKKHDAERHLFFLAISTRTRSEEPNKERGSARVRVCKKQEEKARREAAFGFSLRYQREPVRRSRTRSAAARGFESAKSKKKNARREAAFVLVNAKRH